MSSRFGQGDLRTLTLRNGDTLTVRRRLNTGEQRLAYQRARGAPVLEVQHELEMLAQEIRPDMASVDLIALKLRVTAAAAGLARATGPIDTMELGFVNVVAYLVDWSFPHEPGHFAIRGEPFDIVASAVNALDGAAFLEIKEAIERHEQEMLAERAAEKNGQAGGTVAPAISPSPFVVAGASSGSEN